MSKKSVVCSILALSMILIGTGYAYWTDTLNVTSKATTGDLDVTFVDLGLYAQYSNETANGQWSIIDGIGKDGYVASNFFERGTSDYNSIAAPGKIDAYYDRAEGYNSVEFDAELKDAAPIDKTVGPYGAGVVNGSDNIVITIDNMYPGYAQTFRTDIVNLGSIAAKLSKLNFEVSGIAGKGGIPINQTTKDMLGIALLIEREYQVPGEEGVNVFELCKAMNLDSSKYFTVGNVEFIRLSALETVSKEVLAKYSTLLALPNENRMDLFIGIAMDPDAQGIYTSGSTKVMSGNDDSLSQETGAQISIDLLWDQFNEGVDAQTTNILEEQNR